MTPPDPPPIFREWLSGDPAPAYLLYGDGTGLAGLLAKSWEGKLRGGGVPIESYRWTLEDLARQALGMDAHENRILGTDLSLDECDVGVAVQVVPVGVGGEL
ncbi:MAG TPA: hypothetical protein VF496_10795, partial [Candidatus Deferrimicrobium sp.]